MLCNLWPYRTRARHARALERAAACKPLASTVPRADDRRRRGACTARAVLCPPSVKSRQATDPNGNWITGMQGWYHDSWFSTRRAICSPSTARSTCSSTATTTCSSSSTASWSSIWAACTSGCPGKVTSTRTEAPPPGGRRGHLPGGDPRARRRRPDPCTVPIRCTKVAFNDQTGQQQLPRRDHLRLPHAELTAHLGWCSAAGRQHVRDRDLRRDGHPTESNFQLTLSGFTHQPNAVRPALRRRRPDRRRGVRLRRRTVSDAGRLCPA